MLPKLRYNNRQKKELTAMGCAGYTEASKQASKQSNVALCPFVLSNSKYDRFNKTTLF